MSGQADQPAVLVRWWRLADIAQRDWPRLIAVLSPDESQRAAAFRDAADQRSFIAAHAMTRQLLASRLGVAAQQLAFRTGAHGKPELAESGWRFNLTHTRTLVAAALAWRVEVGIDAEALDPDRIAGLDLHAMFTEAECAELGAQPMPEAILRRWTLKEAWLKAQGIGLGFAPNELHVHLGPPPSVVPTAACPAADWQVWSLIPEPSHVMAVAAMGRLALDVAAYDLTGSSVIACN